MANIIGIRQAQTNIGASGTAIYGGYVVSNERNRALSGQNRFRTYSNLLANVAIISASIRLYQNLITQANWQINAANDSPEGRTVAEEAEQAIFSSATPWRQIVRRSCMYRFWGFSVQEWSVRKHNGNIVLADVVPRPQRTIWRWWRGDDGEITELTQRDPQTSRYITLPRGKLVYLVDDSLNDSPEGFGLFRHVYESAQKLQQFEDLETRGYERDMRGVPVGRAPLAELNQQRKTGQITENVYNRTIDPLIEFVTTELKQKNTGLILDSTPHRDLGETQSPSSTPKFDIDLLRGDTPAFTAIHTAIERKQREIARVLGTEHLLLGDGAGNRALSQDKSNNFAIIVDSALADLAAGYQRDLIRPLAYYNGWPEDLIPSLRTEAVRIRDPRRLTQSIRDLSNAGVEFNREDKAVEEVMDLLGLAKLENTQ